MRLSVMALVLVLAGCSSTSDALTEQYPVTFERASGLAVGEPAQIQCDAGNDFAIGGTLRPWTDTLDEQIGQIASRTRIAYDFTETLPHPHRPLSQIVHYKQADIIVAEVVIDDVSNNGDGSHWMGSAIQACLGPIE